ncbi:MAG TPA: hypothetical protein DCY07_06915 [Rhodospirillaceae bacterium]|nr:hypothetical protein [Rhodospirillaceae bacterium]
MKKIKKTFLGFFLVGFCLLISVPEVVGSGIQMLPPKQSSDLTKPACLSGEGDKLLSWDGATAIKCNVGVVVDSTGLYVGSATSRGSLYIGAANATNGGAQVTLEGAGNFDTWYANLYQNNLRFYTQSLNDNVFQFLNNGAGRVRLTVDGDVFIGGNDTDPSYLRVGYNPSGDRTAAIYLSGDTTYPSYGLYVGRTGGANSQSAIIHRGTGTLYLETTEAARIQFNTANVGRVWITATGSVGVGDSSPAAKLDVAGGVKVANDAAACAAAKAGTIRWSGTGFQGCNGTAWVTFGTKVSIDYTTCRNAVWNDGSGLNYYFNKWGATAGGGNINIACTERDYVMVATDDHEVVEAYCCKLKIE